MSIGGLISSAQSYRWVIKSPVHNYYGESDEAISTGSAIHRGTFVSAVPQWKVWFDTKN